MYVQWVFKKWHTWCWVMFCHTWWKATHPMLVFAVLMLLASFAANSPLSLLDQTVRRGYVGYASSSSPDQAAGPVPSRPTYGLGGVGLCTEKCYAMATLFQEVICGQCT